MDVSPGNDVIRQAGTLFSVYENVRRPTGYYRCCGVPIIDYTPFDLHKALQ